jgi:hypothetical protein
MHCFSRSLLNLIVAMKIMVWEAVDKDLSCVAVALKGIGNFTLHSNLG